jgi:hypothetical protein
MNTSYSIEIHSYKKAIPSARHSFIKNTIKSVINASKKLEKVDVYDFAGQTQAHHSGKERLFIFANSTHDSYAKDGTLELDEPVALFGIENTIKTYLPVEGKGIPIVENGIIIAEFMAEKNVLNITFDLFSQTNEVIKVLLAKILSFINAEYDKENLLVSWKYTSDKEALSIEMLASVTRKAEIRAKEARDSVDSYRHTIEDKKRQLATTIQNLQRAMKESEVANSGMKEIAEKYLKDFDLLVAHEKIEDVRFIDGKIEVFTVPLFMYDEDGLRFKLGKCRFVINMENADVKFYSANPRRSYWSHHDPHPHVSGNDNHACLGNVSSTIAELVAYSEVYALALTCIDFLEAVNRDDSAGKYVTNWDEVDEDGNVITEGRVDKRWDDEDDDQGDDEDNDDEDNDDEDGEDN